MVVLFTTILCGQLTWSIPIDHYGLFGLEERPVTLLRLIGVGTTL